MRLQVARVWLVPGMYFAASVLAGCGGSNGGTLIVTGDASMEGTDGAAVHPGDDSGSVAQDDGGAGSGGGSGSSGSGSPSDDGTDDSGSGSKSGSGNGGMPPIPVPDGGAPSDPGDVPCGGSECPVSTSICCQAKSDGGVSETCTAANAGCSGITFGCNEASDCGGGVCCQGVNAIGVQGPTFCAAPGATCEGGGDPTFPLGAFQTCRTDAECGTDSDAGFYKRCIPQVCTSPTIGGATTDVEACAVAPSLAPGPEYPHDGALAYCTPK